MSVPQALDIALPHPLPPLPQFNCGDPSSSARKFLVQKLSDSDVPPTEIIQISGHKYVSSVNSYSHINTKKHKRISAMITSDENQKQEHDQKTSGPTCKTEYELVRVRTGKEV